MEEGTCTTRVADLTTVPLMNISFVRPMGLGCCMGTRTYGPESAGGLHHRDSRGSIRRERLARTQGNG